MTPIHKTTTTNEPRLTDSTRNPHSSRSMYLVQSEERHRGSAEALLPQLDRGLVFTRTTIHARALDTDVVYFTCETKFQTDQPLGGPRAGSLARYLKKPSASASKEQRAFCGARSHCPIHHLPSLERWRMRFCLTHGTCGSRRHSRSSYPVI